MQPAGLEKRIEEEQGQADKQAVNTGGFCHCTADQQGFGNCAGGFGLSADCLNCFTGGVTFADTRADTGDQSEACADCGSCTDKIGTSDIPFL